MVSSLSKASSAIWYLLCSRDQVLNSVWVFSQVLAPRGAGAHLSRGGSFLYSPLLRSWELPPFAIRSPRSLLFLALDPTPWVQNSHCGGSQAQRAQRAFPLAREQQSSVDINPSFLLFNNPHFSPCLCTCMGDIGIIFVLDASLFRRLITKTVILWAS